MSTKPEHFFSADRPIERLDDDRLQRRAFARSIAQATTTWQGDDSLVMALYGGWGDGKSSVKGMVVDAMKKDSGTCPFIVHFDPWEWAGQNQLAQVFFDEIGKQIAHQGSGRDRKRAEECGRRLQKLGKYLNLTGAFMTPLGYAANLAFPFASIVTDVAAKALKKSGELAKQAAEAVEERKEREDSTLLTVKSELKVALTALKRNVVVLVDDIDRLAADEIKLLFQLIKANSDFPNLIFFLFFQRDIIERALETTIRTGTGRDYLEKIVQVPLSLPQIQRPLLESFMDTKLRDLAVRRGLEARFDWPRLKRIWAEGMGSYFQNLRDAARFFGTFEFQVAAFPDPVEFDPVDLFALEVLRLFENGVYEELALSRPVLAPDDPAEFRHDPWDTSVTDEWNKAIKGIVNAGKPTRPDAAEAILKALFPMELMALPFRMSDNLGRLQTQARVGHPAFFGRYFHLCLPMGDVPQTDVLGLLDATSNANAFRQILLKLDENRLALEALTRLTAYSERFEPKHTAEVSHALFNEGDRLVGNYSDNLWEGFSAIACSVIEAHLAKLRGGTERSTVLKSCFENTTGIYLPAALLRREESRANEYAQKVAPTGVTREQHGALENAQLDELARICLSRFYQAAKSGSLQAHAKLKNILDWWFHWSRGSEAVKGYFNEMVRSDSGLLTLLDQYLGMKLSEDPRQQLVNRQFDHGLIDFEQFMPVEEIKPRVEELTKKQLPAQQTKLCAVFMEAYAEHVRNRHRFPAEIASGATAPQ